MVAQWRSGGSQGGHASGESGGGGGGWSASGLGLSGGLCSASASCLHFPVSRCAASLCAASLVPGMAALLLKLVHVRVGRGLAFSLSFVSLPLKNIFAFVRFPIASGVGGVLHGSWDLRRGTAIYVKVL